MSDSGQPEVVEAPKPTLTIRMLMIGKEVGPFMGKHGETINSIRQESGATIHVSDASIPERIVTVTGSIESICKSFDMMCQKLEDENGTRFESYSRGRQFKITLKLIVPASQCGSLIGTKGARIKQIKERSGASVVVASDMLMNSTERVVTVIGPKSTIPQCIYYICQVLIKSPPKGSTISYTPKPNGMGAFLHTLGNPRRENRTALQGNPLMKLLGIGSDTSSLEAVTGLAGSQVWDGRWDRGSNKGLPNVQTYEMVIPRGMSGCIIGRNGSKIAEIRQLSGATITFPRPEPNGDGGPQQPQFGVNSPERLIFINGNPDSVALAMSLINLTLELKRSKLERYDDQMNRGNQYGHYEHGRSFASPNLGLARVLSKPEALSTALSALANLANLGSLGGGLSGGMVGAAGARARARAAAAAGAEGLQPGFQQGHVAGVHPQRGFGSNEGPRTNQDEWGRDFKRFKFGPY